MSAPQPPLLWPPNASGPPSGLTLLVPGGVASNPYAIDGSQGCLGATFNRRATPVIHNANVSVSGVLALWAIDLPVQLRLTAISFWSGTTALAAGANQWFGIFDRNRFPLMLTADDGATAWAATTRKTLTLAAPLLTPYAGLYYLGILVVAGTVPTIFAVNPSLNVGARAEDPSPGGASTVGLTTPASCGVGQQTAITTRVGFYYGEVS